MSTLSKGSEYFFYHWCVRPVIWIHYNIYWVDWAKVQSIANNKQRRMQVSSVQNDLLPLKTRLFLGLICTPSLLTSWHNDTRWLKSGHFAVTMSTQVCSVHLNHSNGKLRCSSYTCWEAKRYITWSPSVGQPAVKGFTLIKRFTFIINLSMEFPVVRNKPVNRVFVFPGRLPPPVCWVYYCW